MHMNKDDYLKKALLDTQERIRDYMNYSEQFDDEKLQNCFRDFARVEADHAQELRGFISDLQ